MLLPEEDLLRSRPELVQKYLPEDAQEETAGEGQD